VTCYSSLPGRQSVVLLGMVLWKVTALQVLAQCIIRCINFHRILCPLLCAAAEPSLVLSPDCKHLAVKEPCSKRICLLSAQDGFKEVLTTLEPLPIAQDDDVVADTVLSCSWSADSKLLLVACKSSAVYLFDRCRPGFGV
jgi:hypothetical protein